MTDGQSTLDGGRPPHTGLWDRFKSSGAVDDAAWRATAKDGGFVGMCGCGGYLRPEKPTAVTAKRTDYLAHCTACPYEMVAPGGRLHQPRARR